MPFTGERKRISVLFADICGSTELIAGLDPEGAARVIEPPLIAIREAVRRFGGTVSEVRGDGLMALFGAPIAQEDHALRACLAAIEIHRRIADLSEASIRVRVGVNSGEVVVRAIRSDTGFDYTAVGNVVHLAARLEQAAHPSTTLLGPATRRGAAGLIEVRQREGLELKGVTETVDAFELLTVREGEHRARALEASDGALRGFFGREHQIGRLQAALERARVDGTHLVDIVGDVGVGKSRLVHEFCGFAAAMGWHIWRFDGSPLEQGLPHAPTRRALAEWLDSGAAHDEGTRGDELEPCVQAWDDEGRVDTTALRALLGLSLEGSDWKATSPERRRERLLGGVTALLAACPEPVVAVFEDVQWMDEETRSLCERLAQSRGRQQRLVIATRRATSDTIDPLLAAAERIAVPVLDDASARALLADEMGDHPGVGRLIELVAERTGGVPLFIEESLRSLIDTGVIRGRSGDFRPARSFHDLVIPDSVESAIGARVDRLPSGLKRLLQTIAAAGTAPREVIAEASGMSAHELADSLAALEHHGFLAKSTQNEAIAFHHALIRDVGYGLLLERDRARLHERVLEALERLAAERRKEFIGLLGLHAQRSGDYEKAVGYLEKAGLKAIGQSAHREAVGFLESALQALASLPSSHDHLRKSVRIRLLLRGCLIPSGDVVRVGFHLEKAEEEAELVGEIRPLGLVYATSTFSDWLAGHYAEGIQAGRRAETISGRVDDLTLRVVTGVGLGLCFHGAGHFEEAATVHRALLARLPGKLEGERFNSTAVPAVLARGFLTHSCAELGQFERAAEYAETSLALATRLGDHFGHALARLGAAHYHRLRHEHPDAEAVLVEGLEDCRRHDLPTVAVALAAELGLVRAEREASDIADPMADLERITDIADDQQIPRWSLDLRLLALSQLALRLGQPAIALQRAAEACQVSRDHGDLGTLGWSLVARARAARATGGERPDSHLDEAAALALRGNRTPLQAEVLFARAEVAAGRARERHAQVAARAFKALGLDTRSDAAHAMASA
ncbi:MAG: adenylate/guanylate cyclase domain-containing protein [Myxococcota bacterium]